MNFNKEYYIYKKEIDWSALNYGINIPVSLQQSFLEKISAFLPKGETKDIRIILENQIYHAKLINIKFNKNKYTNHKDLIQIRYSPNSDLSLNLKSIFSKSYNYISSQKANLSNKRKHIILPKDHKEYIIIYSTMNSDTLTFEYLTENDIHAYQDEIKFISEEQFEYQLNYNQVDLNAEIYLKNRVDKIRKLNRSIIDNLKTLYDYKCQICGKQIGSEYGEKIIEAHHIVPFVKSKNNNSDNLLIVCPNHHRIIHQCHGHFIKSKLAFRYQNGFEERLIINKHLK